MNKKQQAAFLKGLNKTQDYKQALELVLQSWEEKQDHISPMMARRAIYNMQLVLKNMDYIIQEEDIQNKTGKDYFEAKTRVTPKTVLRVNNKKDDIKKPTV